MSAPTHRPRSTLRGRRLNSLRADCHYGEAGVDPPPPETIADRRARAMAAFYGVETPSVARREPSRGVTGAPDCVRVVSEPSDATWRHRNKRRRKCRQKVWDASQCCRIVADRPNAA